MKKKYFLWLACLFFTCFFSPQNYLFAQKIKIQSNIVLEKDTPCPKNDCASCEIIFPKITSCPNKNLEKKLVDEILIMVLGASTERPHKLFGEKAKAFIQDYKETKKTTDGMGKWQQKIKVELLEMGELVTIAYKEYTYSGGELPFDIKKASHFDLKTAKKITLDDILIENYKEKLLPIMEEKLRKTMKIDAKTPLKDVSELKLNKDKLTISEAYNFRKDGLHFNYSTYEITQPTITPPTLVISYKELKPFLKKNNLLKK